LNTQIWFRIIKSRHNSLQLFLKRQFPLINKQHSAKAVNKDRKVDQSRLKQLKKIPNKKSN
jgi:hypothetical protein